MFFLSFAKKAGSGTCGGHGWHGVFSASCAAFHREGWLASAWGYPMSGIVSAIPVVDGLEFLRLDSVYDGV